jgi:hypothetical protein
VLAIAPSDPATLYAALVDAMSKSTDGGKTWIPITSGLPPNFYFYYGFTPSSIAVDPLNSYTVYLGNVDGVYKTTDGGAKWNGISNMPKVPALAIEAGDPSIVYAASNVAGVVKSDDGGTTFTGAGLIDKRVRTLVVTGMQPAILYAGTEDGHVYRSSNGGKDWRGFDSGLTRAAVLRLAVDSSGGQLYAATAAGVYEYHAVNDDLRIERLIDDPVRLPRLLNQFPLSAGFVLPIIGTASGAEGTLFTTDVALSNNRDSAQEVFVAWLPQGGGSEGVRSFRLTLPASSDAVRLNDFAERLGVSGIGSLVLIALDGNGNLDPNASIGGSAEIWTHPNDGRAPFSQSIPAVRSPLFAEHVRAEATGLRHDAAFRTNVGIVNLSGEMHQFTVALNGERASDQFTIAVPPFSLVQTAVPSGDYGALSLVGFADTSTRWLFYGSTIDNVTGEARTTVATPSGGN